MLKSLSKNCLLIILICLISTRFVIKAQAEIRITMVVPEYNEASYKAAIEQFELENPSIEVIIQIVEAAPPFFFGGDIEAYLDAVANYAQPGDVLLLNDQLLPEASRAGYFLDLSPLVNADGALNPDDFYPTLWDSFQWDAGFWAIPLAGDVNALFYNPAVFDEAGLAYPNENWSATELSNAIQKLTVFNSSGELLTQGFTLSGTYNSFGMLLTSMLGDDLIDDSVLPNLPDFSNPRLEPLLNTWADLINTKTVGGMRFGSLPSAMPLSLGTSFLGMSFDATPPHSPAPFPGGGIGVDPYGLAISAGSLHPQAAYKLITFLTNSPELLSNLYSQIPARRSMLTVANGSYNQMSEELQTFIIHGMETGISLADARFSNYLAELLFTPIFAGEELNLQAALAEIQTTWTERLRIADNRRLNNEFTVLIPPTATALPANGEINLVFGIAQSSLDLASEQEWSAFLNDFAADEAEIAAVQLETNLTDTMTNLDCYYTPSSNLQSINPQLLISLDPLMATDPNLDINDFLPTVLSQVQQNGLTWAFPINLQPLVLKYQTEIFAEAGIAFPEDGWTTEEFEFALRNLQAYIGADTYPFSAQGFNNTYLLGLIVAYGGLPIDTRTTPITYNFTQPATVDAIHQVLDLVTQNYIAYSGFTKPSTNSTSTLSASPIYAQELVWSNANLADSNYRLTNFPSGASYTAISFDLGAAYINANARDIAACYRLISRMANQPHLFNAMPARYSLINSAELVNVQGQATVDFYNGLSATMSRPNTIILPTLNSLSRLFELYWLNRVFDNYVAGETPDLASALAEAEQYTLAFQECSSSIPASLPSNADPDLIYSQYLECAATIDPSSVQFFQRNQ